MALCSATFLCWSVYRRLLHTPRQRTQAHADRQQQQLQRAGHEPVCPVPGAVDDYLLFNRASTLTLRAFYSADIGIVNFATPFNSVACCLMLVAGRLISQRISPAFRVELLQAYSEQVCLESCDLLYTYLGLMAKHAFPFILFLLFHVGAEEHVASSSSCFQGVEFGRLPSPSIKPWKGLGHVAMPDLPGVKSAGHKHVSYDWLISLQVSLALQHAPTTFPQSVLCRCRCL